MPRVVPLILLAIALSGCRSEREAAPQAKPEAQRVPRKYALLVNGDTEQRHGRNIAEAWRTLRALGFEADSITVLTPRDRRIALPKEALRLRPVEAEFKAAMEKLAAGALPGDLVVFYGTGHGDTSEEGESYLELGRGEVWAFDLRDFVERLRADTVVVLDQCFSGGFSDAFDGITSRAMVVTTVDAEHPTECTYFADAFWKSFLDPKHADRNRDGKTSVREAFATALRAHQEALEGDPELRSNGSCRSFNGLEDAVLN